MIKVGDRLPSGAGRWFAVLTNSGTRFGAWAAAAGLVAAAGFLPLDSWGSDASLKLTSSAFSHNGAIPSKYTCQGDDVSVPLAWSGAPAGTKSFALIVDDPDAPDPKAPQVTWVHWVLYNIPSSAKALKEAVKPKELPSGTREGLNDWERTGYRGPCQPVGRHRYFHKVYALDTVLPDLKKPTKGRLEKAMQGHILGKAELIGTYQQN
jgi:Raf kinase inhibitor-like YbhB/YbcL family protein